MPNFDCGVSSYIHATATVDVYFPVDAKGNGDVNCYQCEFFHRTSNRCGINGRICAYPQKYIGQYCPLNFNPDGGMK
jgi:hypothetical protein